MLERYSIAEIGGKPAIGVFGGYGKKLSYAKYDAPYYYFEYREYTEATSSWSTTDRA